MAGDRGGGRPQGVQAGAGGKRGGHRPTQGLLCRQGTSSFHTFEIISVIKKKRNN